MPDRIIAERTPSRSEEPTFESSSTTDTVNATEPGTSTKDVLAPLAESSRIVGDDALAAAAPCETHDCDDYTSIWKTDPITDTLHHEALGRLISPEALDTEDSLIETLSEHFTYLVHSPHYGHFLRLVRGSESYPGFNLGKFAARMCAVGLLLSRLEFSRPKSRVEDLFVGDDMKYIRYRHLRHEIEAERAGCTVTLATFIDPADDPRSAYNALLHGLHLMAAHCPLIIEGSGAAAPELLPAPDAVARESGFIAFTAQQDHESLPGQPCQIKAGDILVVEPQGSYGPGDTLLLAAVDDEFTLAGLREDGTTVWLRGLEEFDTLRYLVVGPVVEVRKGRKTAARC